MKEIILAWTRDYTLAWAEWWSRDMNSALKRVFGKDVPNQLSFYNGRLLETYRLVEEANAFIEAVVASDLEVLNEDAIIIYLSKINEIRALLKQSIDSSVYTDSIVFERLKKLSYEAYPWYTVSYLLPQDKWAPKLIAKYPQESGAIIERLIYARTKSEGTVEELVEYWRAVARALLSIRHCPGNFSSFVTFGEIEHMLADPKYTPDFQVLYARAQGYIFLKDTVYTGIARNEFFEKRGLRYNAPAEPDTSHILKGTVSCSHSEILRGRVSIVLTNEEVKNFIPRNILVTVMTNPFFIPIMKQATAIITDEGGITCHAAIVSRELQVPCITGTKIATRVLKDGDMVEVDANKGIVRKV